MSDTDETDFNEETSRIIQQWELEMVGRDMPTHTQFDQRSYVPNYDLPDPALSLLARFGMPQVPTASVVQPGKEFGDKYKDYCVELFGVRGQLRKGKRTEQPDGVFEIDESSFIAGAYGVWEFPVQQQNVESWFTLSVHVWRMRLVARGLSPYVEQIWQTVEGRWLRNVLNMNAGLGPDIVKDAANLKKLADGLRLFNLVIEQVKLRSPHERVYSFEAFKQDAYQAIEQLARQPGRRRGKKNKRRARRILAKEVLADKIGCGKQTLYDFINENEGLWGHFEKLFEMLRADPSTSLSDALNRL
jgi:hypothetical protein